LVWCTIDLFTSSATSLFIIACVVFPPIIHEYHSPLSARYNMYSYYNSNYLYCNYTWQLSYMKTFSLFVKPSGNWWHKVSLEVHSNSRRVTNGYGLNLRLISIKTNLWNYYFTMKLPLILIKWYKSLISYSVFLSSYPYHHSMQVIGCFFLHPFPSAFVLSGFQYHPSLPR
jgi:hypothetical protein